MTTGGPPPVSLVVVAVGPERVVARALESAIAQDVPSGELVIVHDRDEETMRARLARHPGGRPATLVPATEASPGALRNAGVRHSTGACFLVLDGSETLPQGHVAAALAALDAHPEAACAAARGGPLFGAVPPVAHDRGDRIDASTLVGSAWSVGPATIRRRAYDALGGFDESLPALADWDFLLALIDAGMTGVLLADSGARHAGDDVRLRETLRTASHLPAMRRIVARHRPTFEAHMRTALVDRERLLKALWEQERTWLERRDAARTRLHAALEGLAALRPVLQERGMRTFDFADLRRTTPVSRSWGSDRGVPVDRHYIQRFMVEHAADVRGDVLEMLDADLTTAYGGDRVRRSDVLDIDPGNARATIAGDLRVAGQLPDGAYDCFILTQTLHLIDDMPAALRTAYRLLKPGGVLLVTLPCASMVAEEYGEAGDHWRVTEAGARALFEQVFRPSDLTIRARGNVLAMTAFLYGLCCDDLEPGELDAEDPAYPLVITVRAQKPAQAPAVVPRAREGAAVLLYHRVAELTHDVHGLAVTPRAFRSQMEHLLESWHVMPLTALADAVAAGDLPERGVALTFDDGYLDNLEVAAPILAELGLPATFFLTAEAPLTPRRFWWDVLEDALLVGEAGPPRIELRMGGVRRAFATSTPAERREAHDALYGVLKASAPVVRDDLVWQLTRQTSVPPIAGAHRPMLAGEVQRLRDVPSIDVGAHGLHHLALPGLSAEDCHREVFESRSALERIVGSPVAAFAYPYGDVSPGAVAAVMAAGFRCAVDCDPRGLRPREHRLRIPRLPSREESGEALGDRLLRALRVSPGP